MEVSFQRIVKGGTYSRHQLTELWGYRGYQALARGIVTPAGDTKVILFVTEGEGQQQTSQRYSNHFDGRTLRSDGPEDHFAEKRLLDCQYVWRRDSSLPSRATPGGFHLLWQGSSCGQSTSQGPAKQVHLRSFMIIAQIGGRGNGSSESQTGPRERVRALSLHMLSTSLPRCQWYS